VENKIVLITGASSGFGYEVSILLAKIGYTVYAGARRLELMEPLKSFGIKPVKLDVTDEENIDNVVNEIVKENGKIDILINNAGYGAYGPIEEVNIEEAKYQLDVNLISIGRLVQKCVPYMRKNGSGRIINIGSLAGKVAMYMGGWYSASKFAIEGLTDALRMELKQFNIKVSLVEPGPFKSGWAKIAKEKMDKYSVNTPYEAEANAASEAYGVLFSSDNFIAKDPIKCSKVIFKAATKKHPKARYKVGSFKYILPFLNKVLPTKLADKMSRDFFKTRLVKRFIRKKKAKNN